MYNDVQLLTRSVRWMTRLVQHECDNKFNYWMCVKKNYEINKVHAGHLVLLNEGSNILIEEILRINISCKFKSCTYNTEGTTVFMVTSLHAVQQGQQQGNRVHSILSPKHFCVSKLIYGSKTRPPCFSNSNSNWTFIALNLH